MKLDVLLGLQWGDEGKGKIVDVLNPQYDIVTRFQGGPNAGHTIEFDGNKFILHTIPSGIFDESTINVIGNGVILDAFILKKELDTLKSKKINANNLLISRKAHLILPSHRLLDAVYEKAKGKAKIGSTLKGIGPTYSDKIGRNGIRVGDIFFDDFNKKYDALKEKHFQIINFYDLNYNEFLFDDLHFDEYEKKWFDGIECFKEQKIIDSEYYINQAINEGKSILAEGAQGTLLDIDFGSYPYVTSSNTITAGVCSGLGVSPKKIGKVFGVFKSYCTRVGSGPFPTELKGNTGDKLRDEGQEYGSTTGRPRRCGWLDIPALKYSIMLNGVDELFMTKADVLSPFEKLKICTDYKIEDEITTQLPFNIKENNFEPVLYELKGWNRKINDITKIESIPDELANYVSFVEKNVGIPVKIISIGADRKQTIIR